MFFYNFQICLNNMGRIRIPNLKKSRSRIRNKLFFRIHNTGFDPHVCQKAVEICKMRSLTCFAGGGEHGQALRAPTNIVDRQHTKLVLRERAKQQKNLLLIPVCQKQGCASSGSRLETAVNLRSWKTFSTVSGSRFEWI